MIENAIAFRKDKLFYYSEANFIRKIPRSVHSKLMEEKIAQYLTSVDGRYFSIEIKSRNISHYFLVEFLAWDSDFFNKKIYKLFTVLCEHKDFELLKEAIRIFQETLEQDYQAQYYFLEIPSEDIFLLQALTACGFRLVETRLACYFDFKEFNHNRKYKVRKATEADIPSLRKAAALMKNNYDRFHADLAINEEIAKKFLATYAESAVRGFVDMVLVPANDNSPPDAFVSYNYQTDKWQQLQCKVAKLILTAVLFETRRGWFYRLSVEMLRDLKEQGLEFAFFQTQSANRVMYRTMEKLGANYGGSSHILSVAINTDLV